MAPDPRAVRRPPARIDARTAWRLVRAVRPLDGAPRRVVDPAGSGARLTVAPTGAWTASAPLTPAARRLVDLYLPLRLPADLVIAQAGQSLDGRIATASGQSHYVTGPADIRRLHRLRALVDAVVVGAATVDADDPRLTVRAVEGTNPVRVVLDPDGRLDRARHLFSDRAAPTITVRRTPTRAAAAPVPGGIDAIRLRAADGGPIDPRAVLRALRRRGLRRVLIEGGGVTVSRFVDAGAVDRLHVAVAPLIIGSGRPAFTLAPIAALDAAIRPACRVFRLGPDVLFDLDLRRRP